VKFAKYLPGFGFLPVVLTRRSIAYHSYDNGLALDAGDTPVFRTESLDPARILYVLGMREYRPRKWEAPVKRLLNFPDNKIGWVPFAFSAGSRIDFDGILVTAPPFSSFIAGYLLAKHSGRPLILDFRDAWLEFPFMRYASAAEKAVVSYWEKKTVERAALVTAVDDNIRDSLALRYPRMAGKIFVIPNGYDPDDFAEVKAPERFTLSYLGTVRRERDPRTLIQAVESLAREGMTGLQLKFIGHIEPRYLSRLKKHGFVEICGHLPYRQAVREFCSAHIAVMITTGDKYFFPSRQNEYLASGLPVIVCGRSAGIHLLEDAFKKGYPGWIFDYGDVDGMKGRIRDIYRKFERHENIRGVTPYREYTRRDLTAKLVRLLKEYCF
jgi:glycosyltransferase involved in cell wall biosynthesis